MTARNMIKMAFTLLIRCPDEWEPCWSVKVGLEWTLLELRGVRS